MAQALRKPFQFGKAGIDAMNHLVLAVAGSIALGGSAYVGLFAHLPQPNDYALYAMVLTGLTVGWYGARKRPVD
jgi:hypothetical protein